MTTGKTIALTRQTFVGKVMSLLLMGATGWGHRRLRNKLSAAKANDSAWLPPHTALWEMLRLSDRWRERAVFQFPIINTGVHRAAGCFPDDMQV